MSIISIILVIVVAFFAGMEGVLDQFEIHQPLVACTLIGLVTGHLIPCVILGGTLQMMALGWANIGAAMAPDVALASVASAIILVQSGHFDSAHITIAYGAAIPLAIAGLFLSMIVRTISVGMVHGADAAAKRGDYKAMERIHVITLMFQGLRIAIPAALLLAIPTDTVQAWLNSVPAWLTDGMAIGGGMVVAVGYAMVINMMATREVWPFFALGFALAAVTDLTLIAFGIIGVAIALIYINLSKMGGNGGGSNGGSGDPVGDILNEY
ncbi:PTS mannose/fructose/sorbose transporter subunit IIC [Weissella kandleri]|uniref:PTS mannose/fructose/sorbose transporter subunit IIC n=1 Tax=Weissella kandleri TaxID=1616 RepID=UPI00387ED604